MRALPWLLATFALAATPASAATLRVAPASAMATAGDPLALDITIGGASDLYAFQFDVGYDPALLSAVAITEGPFLAAGGSTVFLPGSIDNVLGQVSFVGSTLLGGIPGVSGSGVLATVQFTAQAAGTGPVALSGVILLDSELRDITAATVGGSVEVVPEPSGLLAIALGVVGLALRARREPMRVGGRQ